MLGLFKQRDNPPPQTLPGDMEWVHRDKGWAIRFVWKGVDYWFHSKEWIDLPQGGVDDCVAWLRTKAYRERGYPNPPFELSGSDRWRYDFDNSSFYIIWKWNMGDWILELWATDTVNSEERFFDVVRGPWTTESFERAFQALRDVRELALQVGWK